MPSAARRARTASRVARLMAELARAALWIGGALLLAWLLRAGVRYARAWTAAAG